jgi:hypothetical protein
MLKAWSIGRLYFLPGFENKRKRNLRYETRETGAEKSLNLEL